MPDFPRSSGVLLHPTSLPGSYGIGDLGDWAYRFIDWLAEHKQGIWQVLPLGPTGYGDSPYQALSTFAGNTSLISLDRLVEQGWLTADDLNDLPPFPAAQVDFGVVGPYHDHKLTLAYERFIANNADQQAACQKWCAANAHWLEDYALFITLKQRYDHRPWVEWPAELALRDQAALDEFRTEHAAQIDENRFRQWVFYTQWEALRKYAQEREIRFFGDIPIFVAHDSCDVWANTGLFYLDDTGNPTIVAGVPPDYFSPTGQRWGNPLYRWDVMKKDGYAWWITRIQAALSLVDYIRFDHFRGLAAYWEIPVEEETAVNGEWVRGPGADFLSAVRDALGDLPIIAEDLGVITEDVETLRDDFGLPGMKVLQFAWSEPKNFFLPHNHIPNSVVYSGTHDNNTTRGWWDDEVDDRTRQFMSTYLEREITDPVWLMIRLGMMSVAHTFIVPMQDILGLGSEARMNTPGAPGGNWAWRMTPEQFEAGQGGRLQHLTWLYQRMAEQQGKEYGDQALKGE